MRAINIGGQGFEDIRQNGDFYIDKSLFIKEWWDNRDSVTLITRPRRFGKTLNLDMLNCFFSTRYAGRSDLFEGLDIWKEEKYRKIQGTYPVIFLSFSNVKAHSMDRAVSSFNDVISQVFRGYLFLKNSEKLEPFERERLYNYANSVPADELANSLNFLSEMLCRHYGKKVLIFLDEYDTPMQETYVDGYWQEMADFIRNLFNATFKTNPSLKRAVMTGITRVSRESIFSDLNNVNVVTMTSEHYETAFGFTEEEVKKALSEYELSNQFDDVKKWYDGFTFGRRTDIYNPWSIVNFLYNRKLDTYWVNTSSNKMISDLLKYGNSDIKNSMETLMNGGSIDKVIDEEMVFSQLDDDPDAVWSLFFAAGYLKSDKVRFDGRRYHYSLSITNMEVELMFETLIENWFRSAGTFNDMFVKSMISGDASTMTDYMNQIALSTISYFDTGNVPSKESTPERFYHGFVLGLLVRERDRYKIISNRESGIGRYDICMYPLEKSLPGIVIEFKVQNENAGEKTLSDTADAALSQIRDKDYAADLRAAGVTDIYQYGFAFEGKKVMIKREISE